MDCTFDAHRLRDFVRALRCLAAFGDELNIVASTRDLRLSAVSASRSAFALVCFEVDFFTRYKLKPEDIPEVGSSRQSSQVPDVQISVTAKTLLNALGKRAALTTVESVALSIVFDEQSQDQLSTECRLVLRLNCKHGVVKTHRLTFAAENALTPLFDRSTCTSHWTVSSITLDEWINHFSSSKRTGTEEISLLCAATFCRLKSYEPLQDMQPLDQRDKDDLAGRAVSTSVHADIEEFDDYNVQGEEVLTFGLKEFKAVIHFGKESDSPMEADYLAGGQPLSLSMQADGYCANFVLATSSDDIADIKKEPTPQMQRNHTKKEQTIAPSIVVEPETAQDSSTRSASADAEVLKSLNHVQTSENGPVGANSGQSNKKAPLFRPSTSPAPSSQQADDHDHVQDMDLQAQLEADDFTIPDSQMNQAWVQFSQRHPEHELENDQRPTISQATEATQEDDDDEEAEPLAEAPQLKKAKWQLFD